MIISLFYKPEAYLRQNRFVGPEILKEIRYLSYSYKIHDLVEMCRNISGKIKRNKKKENKKQNQILNLIKSEPDQMCEFDKKE